MKPFAFRLAVVLSAAAVIAVAYLAGAMGVGAGEDVGWPMVADATVVDFGTSLGTAEAVRVVSYDEGALLCVNQASAQACTTQGAEAPMLAFVDAPTGSSVVVVDPRGRIVGLRMTDLAGVVQDVPSDSPLAASASIVNVRLIEVVDTNGAVLTAIDTSVREDVHSMAEDSKDIEPHH